VKEFAKKVLPPSLHGFARNVYSKLTYRSRPSMTNYPGAANGVLGCCVAYNKHGAYCVPLSAHHRPAAQKILRGEVWESKTIDYLTAHCGAGDIVHAGTFFGDFLPALSRACAPGAKVWAFEPNPENYRCAGLTIQLNGLANVTLTNAGLGAEHSSLAMVTKDTDGSSLGGLSRIVADGAGADSNNSVAVNIVTVDEVVPVSRTVSIIQLDVEGFEQPALAGALATIKRCRPLILLEAIPEGDWLAQNIFGLGYQVEGEVHGNAILRCK
jgi:FkbM family methyltransferase